MRGYWTYLGSIQAVPEDDTSFEKLSLPRGAARGSNGRPIREAFTATEVVHLLHIAEQNNDTTLADLIRLGMYTGARIEELCSVKVEDVRADHFEVVDAKMPPLRFSGEGDGRGASGLSMFAGAGEITHITQPG